MESLYLIIRKSDGSVFTGFKLVNNKMTPTWASAEQSALTACYFRHAAMNEALTNLSLHIGPLDDVEVATFQRVS